MQRGLKELQVMKVREHLEATNPTALEMDRCDRWLDGKTDERCY